MARFYASFADTLVTDLDYDYFVRLRVGASSASGAQLRDGLIASKSAISNEVYDDLDAVNKDFGKGTYFPAESSPGPFSSDFSTYASWSTAYTSSIEGIKRPTSNDYGADPAINYSKRPTASVAYNNSGVAQANPADPVQVSYAVYFSASAAVRAVLNSIESRGDVSSTIPLGTKVTPFGDGRDIQALYSPTRTIYTVWHDPDLTYFAWDDFSPGTASVLQTINNPALAISCLTSPYATANLGNPIDEDLQAYFQLGGGGAAQFITDTHPDTPIGAKMIITSWSADYSLQGPTYTIDAGYDDTTYEFVRGTDTGSSNGPVGPRTNLSSSWAYTAANSTITWTIALDVGYYKLTSQWRVRDIKIPANERASFGNGIYTCNNNNTFNIVAQLDQ